MNDAKRDILWVRALVGAVLVSLPALGHVFDRKSVPLLAEAMWGTAFVVGLVGWAFALWRHRSARAIDGAVVGFVASVLAHVIGPLVARAELGAVPAGHQDWDHLVGFEVELSVVLGAINVGLAAARTSASLQASLAAEANARREAVWWRALVGGLVLAVPAALINVPFARGQIQAAALSAFVIGALGWAIALRLHNTARDTDGAVVGIVTAILAHPAMFFLLAVQQGRHNDLRHVLGNSMLALLFTGVVTVSIGMVTGLLTSVAARRRRKWLAGAAHTPTY